ncbi:MAG: FISUMP domain-containing protein, partial [Dysgonomonas sp.]
SRPRHLVVYFSITKWTTFQLYYTDIKEYTANDNTTATKGMMLPRVNLTDMSNLYPMFLGDTDYENNTANKKDTEDAIHTGLTVYNTSVDFCADIYPGVRVWDGAKWEPIGEGRFPAEVDILIDNRNPAKPERYQIGKFGNGGWWMLENLRADRWPDGTADNLLYAFPTGDMEYRDENNVVRHRGKQQYYPAMGDPAAVARHGYMYTLYAALRLKQEDKPEFISEMRNTQGICPDGWHVPSTQEYYALREEIELNPCKYAHSNIGENSSYNIQPMGETPNGRGRIPKQGGFNFSLLGALTYSNGADGKTPNVDVLPVQIGEWGQFWKSDGDLPEYDRTVTDKFTSSGWEPAILSDVNRMAEWSITLYIEQISVRCIKDNSANLSRSKSTMTDSNMKVKKVEKTERPEIGYLK